MVCECVCERERKEERELYQSMFWCCLLQIRTVAGDLCNVHAGIISNKSDIVSVSTLIERERERERMDGNEPVWMVSHYDRQGYGGREWKLMHYTHMHTYTRTKANAEKKNIFKAWSTILFLLILFSLCE